MEAMFEKLIELFLTCDQSGKVYLAPQYQIDRSPPPGENSVCPDAVLIDDSGDQREVVVIEITTAANIGDLKNKILERESRWFSTLRQRFDSPVRLIAFVRKDLVDNSTTWAIAQGIRSEEVCFFALEEAVFSWKYWNERRKNGLPR